MHSFISTASKYTQLRHNYFGFGFQRVSILLYMVQYTVLCTLKKIAIENLGVLFVYSSIWVCMPSVTACLRKLKIHFVLKLWLIQNHNQHFPGHSHWLHDTCSFITMSHLFHSILLCSHQNTDRGSRWWYQYTGTRACKDTTHTHRYLGKTSHSYYHSSYPHNIHTGYINSLDSYWYSSLVTRVTLLSCISNS